MKSVAAHNPPKAWFTPDQDSSRPSPSQPALLSNGHYNVRVSEVGSGSSALDSVAITRSAADETRDADGFYIYLRDLDDGRFWAAGFQPTRGIPARYSFSNDSNRVQITRLDYDIECQLTISVGHRHNFEVRRCRLTNLGT